MTSSPRVPLLAAAVCAVALLAFAPSASAGLNPAPFGHACTAQDGVRFCPTADLAGRVKSWDGVPLDVDVTLPATGEGPFPTILLLHGLGGTKRSFESASGKYTNVGFAKQGYAVVTPTARGFGNSCGSVMSRTAGCEKGWTHLGDMRYEVRDLQYMVGLLVDQKITDPKAIGSTGISYGGGFSTMLAFLKDRIRLPNNKYAAWKSPKGTPLSLTAAWPRWLWSNGEAIFTRNGRGYWSRSPLGAVTQAWADIIFSTAFGGFTAPDGVDPTADIHVWKKLLDTASQGAAARKVLDQSYEDHGVAGVGGGAPSPLLLQSGWTDALFPVPQGRAAYDAILAKNPKAPVAMQVGDLGHGGANKAADDATFNAQGFKFFDSWLKGKGKKLAPGTVTAFTATCPTPAAGGGPFSATSFEKLTRGAFAFGSKKPLAITSAGASQETASAIQASASVCKPVAPDATSKAVFSADSTGLTLIGQPALTGTVKTKGKNGQLDARLWDLDPAANTQQLITRGVYRLTDNQKGAFRLDLDGNGWKFAKGHKIVVELLGKDSPTYQASPNAFSATLTGVNISLPVRERVK